MQKRSTKILFIYASEFSLLLLSLHYATPLLTSDVLTFYVCFQMSKKNSTDAPSGAESKKPVVVPSKSRARGRGPAGSGSSESVKAQEAPPLQVSQGVRDPQVSLPLPSSGPAVSLAAASFPLLGLGTDEGATEETGVALPFEGPEVTAVGYGEDVNAESVLAGNPKSSVSSFS